MNLYEYLKKFSKITTRRFFKAIIIINTVINVERNDIIEYIKKMFQDKEFQQITNI